MEKKAVKSSKTTKKREYLSFGVSKRRGKGQKMQKRIAKEESLFYEELLKKEINEDRDSHGKKPLKEKEYAENHVTIRKGDFIMSSYTHFTEEEKEQARNTDIVSFLRQEQSMRRLRVQYTFNN